MANRTEHKAEATRASIYARVSDKSQAEDDKTSISEQIAEMEAHCQRRGLTIVARYQEVGRGWSKTRPEFQRMLSDARNGRFDTIVCWKSDRLSRGMYPAAALMEVVDTHQINLDAVMDSIDMKTFGLMLQSARSNSTTSGNDQPSVDAEPPSKAEYPQTESHTDTASETTASPR